MSEVRYQYLFNEFNELVHYTKAIKGDKYRLYPNQPLDYIFKAGDKNIHHFSLKTEGNNPLAGIGGKGESPEHYNAKMDIVSNKKYFDTIFEKWIEFDQVNFETTYDNKRPDLSCFINNELVCCIEIRKTNAKSESDILELKKISVPIIEIDINNENKCKHIILPTLLEANRQKLADLNFRMQELGEEKQGIEAEYNRLADQLQSGLSGVTREIEIIKNGTESFKRRFKDKCDTRIKNIDNWLQTRMQRFGIEDDADEKIKPIEREIKKIENEAEKTNYRIGKLEQKISQLDVSIRDRRKSFEQIAKQSKIEWFRNSWMNYTPQNIVQEIKYWLS